MNVKKILMEHLESVQEGTDRAREVVDSNAGISMDPENEQNNADCQMELPSEHPDFLAKNPEDLQVNHCDPSLPSAYKRIDLDSEEQIEAMTLSLDKEQRLVLDIGVDYVKNLVKARKAGSLPPKAPLLIVQGGAGTGKSTVINALSQQMEKILRKSGDDPTHPYIIKCAFTGTAAANIMGPFPLVRGRYP